MDTPDISRPVHNTLCCPLRSGLTHRLWVSANAFTDNEQKIAKKRWQVNKDRHGNLENVETTFVTILECAIEKYYHTGGTIMRATGFRTLTDPQIISRMQHNYGKPEIGEIKKALLRLN